MPQDNNVQTFGLDDDANVQDFMTRFSDPHTYVPPEEVHQQFDRFAQANHPEFQQAAGTMVSQMDPGQFVQAAQSLEPTQRAGFAQVLANALGTAGLDLGGLASRLGLSTTDPRSMQPQDIGRLAGYAQQNAPGALQQAAREQPFILKALGNPLVAGALAIMGARYLSRMRQQR